MLKKFRIFKILKEYERVFAQDIPDKVYGRRELLAIKDLELEKLALAYDVLEGWKYYPLKIPTYSKYMCSMYYPTGLMTNSISRAMTQIHNRRFRAIHSYEFYPKVSGGGVYQHPDKSKRYMTLEDLGVGASVYLNMITRDKYIPEIWHDKYPVLSP